MKNLVKVLNKFFSTSFHFLAFIIIFFLIQRVSGWYLGKIPVLGVDFFNSVTYVTYFSKHLGFLFNSFVDNWFAGYPLSSVFVSAHWHLMIPFANKFGMVKGIEIYVLASLYLLIVFSYLLYFQLSKSRSLALLGAFFVLFSVNIYGSFTWGGSLPFFATQFFLPFVLLLVDKYLETQNKRWFYAAILATGIGFYAHPLPIFAFVIPCVSILLFLCMKVENRGFLGNILERFFKILLFLFGSLAVALPISYGRLTHTAISFLTSGPGALVSVVIPSKETVAAGEPGRGQGISQADEFYQGLVKFLYLDTNVWLFWLVFLGAVLFLFSFAISRKKYNFLHNLAFIIIVLYAATHTILNAYGYAFLPQGWYRAYWAFPIVLGGLISVLWGEFFSLIRERSKFGNYYLRIFFSNLPGLLFAFIFLVIGYLFFTTKTSSVIEALNIKSEISSAHPQALSIKISESEREELKKQLLPSFIDGNDKNKRLYEADALVNIWWTSFYDLPLVRGYIDPPIATSERGGFFWLDIAISNDSLTRDFKVEKEVAFNNALFLMDWYGIYYFEGGRLGISTSAGPSSYLLENNVFEKNEQTVAYGALLKWQTASGKPELHPEVPQYLNFYKVKDEFTSPVIYGNNSPVVAVFSNLAGYEDFLRGIAWTNINSQYLIPVRAGEYIDDMDSSDFSNFDAVILTNYKYHNQKKAYSLLTEFTLKGGKVFIDSGAENADSQKDKLPNLFPFGKLARDGLGKVWSLESTEDSLIRDVDFSKFSPPIFNEDEWKLAFPKDSVEQDAKVLLTQSGKPILIKQQLGDGEIIWSGMNLFYHINQYKNSEEAKLFTNIIGSLIPLEKKAITQSSANWLKPEKVVVESKSSARGVLFKEEGYPGWHTKLQSSGGKKLKIYKTGPTYPGFMYVALPKAETFKLEFNYSAERSPILVWLISLMIVLILLDLIFIRGFLLSKCFNFFSKSTRRSIGRWWEKEDE